MLGAPLDSLGLPSLSRSSQPLFWDLWLNFLNCLGEVSPMQYLGHTYTKMVLCSLTEMKT